MHPQMPMITSLSLFFSALKTPRLPNRCLSAFSLTEHVLKMITSAGSSSPPSDGLSPIESSMPESFSESDSLSWHPYVTTLYVKSLPLRALNCEKYSLSSFTEEVKSSMSFSVVLIIAIYSLFPFYPLIIQ